MFLPVFRKWVSYHFTGSHYLWPVSLLFWTFFTYNTIYLKINKIWAIETLNFRQVKREAVCLTCVHSYMHSAFVVFLTLQRHCHCWLMIKSDELHCDWLSSVRRLITREPASVLPSTIFHWFFPIPPTSTIRVTELICNLITRSRAGPEF